MSFIAALLTKSFLLFSILLGVSNLPAVANKIRVLPQTGVRNAHGMAYDSDRRRVILFGGADESRVRGETWEWNGKRWSLVSSAGPGQRTFPAMAYDNVRKRVVLFGGNRVLFGRNPNENQFLNDTWEWDGHSWTQIKVGGPPSRAEAAMAFDSKRGRIVLFGGHDRSGSMGSRFGDTWEWDGKKWIEMKVVGPSPRNGSAMAYDNVREKIVLFGGSSAKSVSGETWEWDGQQWTKNQAALVQGRFNSVMAYDSARRKIIRFGGRFAGKPLGDTWEYDGKGWTQVTSTGPSPRNHAAMVYDSNRKIILLFGGHDFGLKEEVHVFGDTWGWDGKKWALKEAGQIIRRVENGH